jgi:hypothetical protein
MGRNLTNLFISQSYEFLTQISGSELQDGLGNDITFLAITASQANNATSASFASTSVSSSFAQNATSASHALNANNAISSSFASNATSASFADNATSASFAQTAAFALNVNTGSLLVTASISNADITFTKGDASTFSITVNNVSNANSASLAANATNAVSSSHALFADNAGAASTATSASHALNADNAISASFATTATSASFASTSISSSFATSASFATTASFALNATPGFPFTGSAQITGSLGVTGSITRTSGSFSGSVIDNITDIFATPKVEHVVTLTQAEYNALTPDDDTLYIISGSIPTDFSTFATTGSNTFIGNQIVTGSVSATLGFTGSLLGTASNATSASFATSALQATSASFATSASQATSASFANNATSASHALNADNSISSSFATTASFASNIANGLNITASNILVNNNLVVNGTASFAYTKTVTGSAVIIGDEFIILNADTPAARYAGIKVYDTGSLTTASLEWDGIPDNWIIAEETGDTAVIITGVTGSRGSELLPTINRLQKGAGHHSIGDSNISDDGTTVSISTPLVVTGSINATSFTGSLQGNASTATSASHALNADNAISASFAQTASFALNVVPMDTGSFVTTASISDATITFTKGDATTFNITVNNVSNADSASVAVSASHALNADNAISASFASTATSASFAINSTSASFASTSISSSFATSASFAETASFALNVVPMDTGSFLITASISDATITFTKGDASTFNITVDNVSNADSASVAVSASHALNADNTISASFADNATSASFATNTLSASFAETASFALNAGSGFPFTGSADISGSLNVQITGSRVGTITSGSFTGSFVTNVVPSASITQQQIEKIVTLDAAAYASLSGSSNVFDDTLYIISDSTGSVIGSTVITGSLRGNVGALSISSNTASLDCSTGNFFTLLLVSGSDTFVNPSNIQPGQTINLRVKQASVASGSISFASSVKQVSGSAYQTTGTADAEDIVTFISFDTSSLYLSNVKNFV